MSEQAFLSGGNKCTACDYIKVLHSLGYEHPYKTVMPLSKVAELTVSGNMGTYGAPIVTAGVEVVKESGLVNLAVLIPTMEILVNTGLEGGELIHYLREIGSNMFTCVEVADGLL